MNSKNQAIMYFSIVLLGSMAIVGFVSGFTLYDMNAEVTSTNKVIGDSLDEGYEVSYNNGDAEVKGSLIGENEGKKVVIKNVKAVDGTTVITIDLVQKEDILAPPVITQYQYTIQVENYNGNKVIIKN